MMPTPGKADAVGSTLAKVEPVLRAPKSSVGASSYRPRLDLDRVPAHVLIYSFGLSSNLLKRPSSHDESQVAHIVGL